MNNPVLLSRRLFCASALMVAAAAFTCAAAKQDPYPPCFTDAERDAARLYWNTPGRYTSLPSPDAGERVNITVEGSTWWLAASKLIAAQRKTDPTTAAQWQSWWDARIAQQKAIVSGTTPIPPDAGAIPPAFAAACLSACPDKLYEKVQPIRYTITFAPEDAPEPFVYEDGIDFAKRAVYYGYYRQRNGVIRAGRKVRDITGDEKKRLDAIFAKAGKSSFERRVLQAVSQYEGGFEAVNTYDTGFVSIGFIQFITAVDGQGSLSEVLQSYKTADRAGFQSDFRRFGIDVSPESTLVCVDPVTGQEVRGTDAVRRVIDDKRLTAVFERAAAGDGFKLAQVMVARSHYWPGEDMLTVVVQDKQVVSASLLTSPAMVAPPSGPDMITCQVSDIIKSEAGMATLMDKKVNRGNIRDFADVARQLMVENKITNPRDLTKYERTIIATMKYRGDFLSDPTLTQPMALRRKSHAIRTAEETHRPLLAARGNSPTRSSDVVVRPHHSRKVEPATTSKRTGKVAEHSRDTEEHKTEAPVRTTHKTVRTSTPKPRTITRVAESRSMPPAKPTKKRR